MYLFLIYMLVLTIYNPSIMGFNLSNYVLICAVILSFFIGKKSLHKLDINLLNGTIIAFYLWIIISNIYSANHAITIVNTIKLTLLIVFGLFLDLIIKDKTDEYKLWNYIICGNVAACAVGLFQLIFQTSDFHLNYGEANDAIRIYGTFETPNVFANFICLSLPIIIVIALKKKRIISFGLLAVNGIIIYETYSRASVVCIVAATILWMMIDSVFITRLMTITKKRLCFIAIGAAIIIVVITNLIITGKMTTMFQTRNSNAYRADSIMRAIQVFTTNPLGQGFGVGSGEILDGAYINVLVDLGVVGIILFLLLIVMMTSESIKMCKLKNDIYTQSILLTVLIVFLLCILENVIYNSMISFFIAIIWYELNFHRSEEMGE